MHHKRIKEKGMLLRNLDHQKKWQRCKQVCALLFIGMLLVAPTNDAFAQNRNNLDYEANNISDPLESFNRAVFSFNSKFDKLFLRPVALTYRHVLPSPARDSVRNFLSKMMTPVTFTNNVLQGNGREIRVSFMRFMINTTMGVAGLFDVASELGLPEQTEDFGQTLGTWGVSEGPYIVLPILGPSNARDTVGIVADIFLDPTTWVATNNDWEEYVIAARVLQAVDARERNLERIERLKEDSFDFYATIRSLYTQNRRARVENQLVNGESSATHWQRFEFEDE